MRLSKLESDNYLSNNSTLNMFSKFLGKRPTYFDLLTSLCVITLPWSSRVNSIGVIIFSICFIASAILERRKKKPSFKTIVLASAIFFTALLWMFFTENLTSGFNYLGRILSGLIFPIMLGFLLKFKEINKKAVIFFFFLSCALRYIIFFFFMVDYELIFIFDYWLELFLQLNQLFNEQAIHTSYFAMFLGFCTLCAYYYARNSTKNKRLFWFIIAGLSFAMNVSLMAKMPLIATFIIMVFWLIKDIVGSSTVSKKAALMISIISLIVVVLKVPNPIKQDLQNYYRLFLGKDVVDIYDYDQLGLSSSVDTWQKTNRLYIWKTSIEILQSNFFIGIGTGDMDDELSKEYGKINKSYFSKNPSNTHNQYLDYLIRYGVIGFLIIFIGFVFYFQNAISTNNEIYLAFLIIVCLCCLTENILNRQFGIVFFFFFNSLFLFGSNKNKL